MSHWGHEPVTLITRTTLSHQNSPENSKLVWVLIREFVSVISYSLYSLFMKIRTRADTKLVFIFWIDHGWDIDIKKYRYSKSIRAPYVHHIVKRFSVCMFLLACRYRPVNMYRYSGLQYLLLFCVIHYTCICTYILYSKSITKCSCIIDLGT